MAEKKRSEAWSRLIGNLRPVLYWAESPGRDAFLEDIEEKLDAAAADFRALRGMEAADD